MGPAVVIGKQDPNYWLARGGRCLLAAPEHLRPADPEEVSADYQDQACYEISGKHDNSDRG